MGGEGQNLGGGVGRLSVSSVAVLYRSAGRCWAWLGAFGAATLFESLRAYLLALTAGLLGLAFCLTYRRKRPREKCQDGTCARGPQKSRKTLLWTVTGTVAVLAAFPYYSGFFRGQAPPSSSTARFAATSGSGMAEFHGEGMTCAAVGQRIKVLYDEKMAHVFDSASIATE